MKTRRKNPNSTPQRSSNPTSSNLTQSTPNSQQIKSINPVNKPTQIKPRSRNQSQQTQINTIKPRSHHQWLTQSSHHHPADQKHFFITWTSAQKPTKIPEHDHHCHRKSHQTHTKTVAEIDELHCGQDRDKGQDWRALLWPRRSPRPGKSHCKGSLSLYLSLSSPKRVLSFKKFETNK